MWDKREDEYPKGPTISSRADICRANACSSQTGSESASLPVCPIIFNSATTTNHAKHRNQYNKERSQLRPSSLPLSGAPPVQRSERRRRGQPGRRRRAPAPRRIPGSALGCQTDSACVCRTALRIIVSPVYTKTRHFAPSLVSTTPNSRSRQPVSYANTASACGIMLLFLLPCAPPERVAP